MKTNSYKFLTLALSLTLLSACQSSDQETSEEATDSSTSGDTVASTPMAVKNNEGVYGVYAQEDYDDSYDEATATTIALDGTAAQIDGEGAVAEAGTVTISRGGTYILTGAYTGKIVVDADKDADIVKLVLNGVTITSEDYAAVYVAQAEKAIVTLAEGTTNTLSDGTAYTYGTAEEDEPDAALFSKDDLTINGSGKLIVKGNYNNGIRGKDDVVIIDGELEVTAVNNGIKGKDSLSILDGSFTINTSAGDGLQVNGTDTDTGWLALDGGTYTITAGNDGVQAETNLSIATADMKIQTADGAQSSGLDSSASYKGLKAGSNLVIDAGNFAIDSADDSLHADQNVTINGGVITASSGDDGVHASSDLLINDGAITITESYEGLEGLNITVAGGTHNVQASDDAMNASGGSDGDTGEGGFGGDQFNQPGGTASNAMIYIEGGTTILKTSGGDGFDSNGSIEMTGGVLVVDGPGVGMGGNGVLDFDGSFTLNGGLLLGVGNSEMAQTPSTDSQQYSLAAVLDSSQTEHTTLNVTVDGTNVLTYTPTASYNFVIASAPEMSAGSTVVLATGGSDTAADDNLLAVAGSYSGGSELGSYSLTDVVTTSGNLNTMGGGGQGGGGQGGGQPGGNRNG